MCVPRGRGPGSQERLGSVREDTGGQHKQQGFIFSQFSEAGRSKIKMPADSFPGESSLLGLRIFKAYLDDAGL